MKSETKLQNEIRCALSRYGVVVRMNSGLFLTPDGRPIRNGIPGIPDLLFIGPGGVVVWIEVKTDTGQLRKDQENFIAMLQKRGHRTGVVKSVEDALRIVKEALHVEV